MGNTPHFNKRLEFAFLYSGWYLNTGVPSFETIFFGWAFLQSACFIDKGERFQDETLNCLTADGKEL